MNTIIVGATSGIGRELAKQMSAEGHSVGITGRRTHLLDSLEKELDSPCFKSVMDLTDISGAIKSLDSLINEMGGVDTVIISSGTGTINPEYPIDEELETIAVNVAGFTAVANRIFRYFLDRGKGHLVGISSVAAVRGGIAASYNASKAFVSSYLEGLLCRAGQRKIPIYITDIRPGFVDTAMAKGEGLFWVAPVDKAARQIRLAIKKRRRIAYVTKRWGIGAFIMARIPFGIYRRISG